MELARALAMGAVGLCLGVIAAGLVGFPRSPLTRPLLAIAVCAAFWAVGDQVAEYSRSLDEEQVGIALLYTGSIFMPSLWWLLALRWAAESGSPLPVRERLWVGTPLVFAAAMWGVMLTNPWHGQFLTPAPGRNVYHALWWVMAVPNYTLNLAGLGVIAWVAVRVRERPVRRQAALLLGAPAFMVASNLLYVLWPVSPGPSGSMAVIAISGGLVYLGLRSHAERRRFERSLRQQVAQRTSELDTKNHQLRLANSRLREAQARLVEAERLDAAEYLAGAVAHAIHNPLAALRGTVELASARSPEDRTLSRVLRLTDRIKNVVDGTLDLVRRSALRLEPQSPAAIFGDVRDELKERAQAGGVDITLLVERDMPRPLVDRPLIVAALVAIAENALEAMPTGGDLELQAETVPGTEVVAFSVADTGPGIPEPVRDKVFEAFFTTKPEGTGLGLPIARGVVQGHGGRILLADRPGGGALVRMEIPVRGAMAERRLEAVG